MNRVAIESTVEYMFEALNNGDYEEFLGFFDDDLVFIHSGGAMKKQALTQFYNRIDTIFQDNHHEIERILIDGSSAVVDCTWSGTHIGAYQDIEPSHKYFETPVTWLFDFVDGKIVYAKRIVDNHVLSRLTE